MDVGIDNSMVLRMRSVTKLGLCGAVRDKAMIVWTRSRLFG